MSGQTIYSMHLCDNPPLQPSHKPSMKCYCLVAQSTTWSSCDCNNLSDLISRCHEWEKEGEIKKWKLERIPKACKGANLEKVIQMYFVPPLRLPSLSSYPWFALTQRIETHDMEKCRFGNELSSKSYWSRDHCAAPNWASKGTQRAQRTTLTCSYTNTDRGRVSVTSVDSFIALRRVSLLRI